MLKRFQLFGRYTLVGFSNFQYNSIMREYEKIRAKNRHELDKRTEKVYQLVPQIKLLNESLSSLALKAFKNLKQDKNAIEKFNKQVEEIILKKQNLLKENGFAADYLDEIYTCPLCKDSAMIDNERCSCFYEKLLKSLYENSNIKSISEDETFENFNFDLFDENKTVNSQLFTERQYIKRVYQICKDFVANFKNKKDNILFIGDTGVGKSFLSNCIARELLNNYHSVIYLTSIQLFEYLEKIRFERLEDEDEQCLEDYIDKCELLIIDDLGTETMNKWTNSQLFRIINTRLELNKSTIISTNYSPVMIRDEYSERISSRILNMYKVIKLYGEDIRQKKQIFGGRDDKSN